MFQPQPTPFANFFPAYLPVGVGVDVDVDNLELELGLGRRDEELRQGQLTSDSYANAQAHAAGFSSYAHQQHQQHQQQQAHQLTPFVRPGVVAAEACRSAGVGNPCPGPVGPVPGSASTTFTRTCTCGHSGVSDCGPPSAPAAPPAPGGLGHGGAAAAGAPLSTIFPLHGAIPHPRLDLDLEPAASRSNNLFDHGFSPSNNNAHTTSLKHLSRHHLLLSSSRRAASRSTANMEPNQSLQDDLAAQEAAARVWQPDIDVRSSPPASILNSPFHGPRQRSFGVYPAPSVPRLDPYLLSLAIR